MQTTNAVFVVCRSHVSDHVVARLRRGRASYCFSFLMGKFHRGGFEDASPVVGDRTVLRPVVEVDVDLLLRWHADPEVLRFWDGETFTRATMLVELARHDVTPYLVLSDGEPVGYLQVWGGPEGGLDMFLAPDARGRGLGSDAGRAMARHLRDDRGWTRVTVDPYAWNDMALRGWRNAGFVEVSRHEVDDEHSAPWVLMEFRDAAYPCQS
jgi:aminoglycoside 6'-N-acetyltransferase